MHYKHTTKRRRKNRGEIFDLENDEEVEIPTAGDEFCNSRGHFHFFPRESEFFQREKRRRREKRKRERKRREEVELRFFLARGARAAATRRNLLSSSIISRQKELTRPAPGNLSYLLAACRQIYIFSPSLSLSPASPKGHV